MEPIPKVLPSETEVARLIEPDAYALSDLEWHDAYGRTTSVTRSLEERGYVRRAALSRARSILALFEPGDDNPAYLREPSMEPTPEQWA